MIKKFPLYFIALVILVMGCHPEKSSTMKASVNIGWTFSSSYAPVALAAREFASQEGLELTPVPAGEGIDPVKMVIAGQQAFGYAGSVDVLNAINQGADLVIIGVIMPKDPGVFISRADKNIRTPQDWKGKRVGRLPGGSMEYIYQALLKKNNLSAKDFQEMTIPYDMGTFIADQYDVRPAFIFDETVSLEMQHIPYTIIDPADFGLDFVGPVIFSRRNTVEQQPTLVQAYINAEANGMTAALADPKRAMDALMTFDSTLDRAREERALQKGLVYMHDKDGRVFHTSISRFEKMQKALVEANVMDKPVDLQRHINFSFIDTWYKEHHAEK